MAPIKTKSMTQDRETPVVQDISVDGLVGLPTTVRSELDPKVIADDIRSTYQVATALIVYEGQLTWRVTSVFLQFAILLIAAAVFPSFIGSVDLRTQAVVGFALSVLGCVASIMWMSMVFRNRKYYQYWLFKATELEQKMAEESTVYVDGYKFSGGATIEFPTLKKKNNGHEVAEFRFLERVKMRSNLLILYFTMFTIFVFLLILNLVRIIAAF